MKEIFEPKAPKNNRNIDFFALSQEFEGGSFYGLEYILEDFPQHGQVRQSVAAGSSVDWFGLYNY